MVAGCGMTCIKYIMFVINFLFFVMGAAAIGLGIYAMVDKSNMAALTKLDGDGKLAEFNGVGLLQSGAIVLIVGGSFLLILGFLGCCGAVKEVKCLLATYAAIVIVIIIIEIAAAVLAIVFQGRITTKLEDGLLKALDTNYDGNHTSNNAFSRAFDFAQVYFECCGVTNASNFANTPWNAKKGLLVVVPDTCCALNRDAYMDNNKVELTNPLCTITAVGADNPNTNKPCVSSIISWIKSKAAIIIGIAFAIVVIELVAVIFACCMHRAIES